MVETTLRLGILKKINTHTPHDMNLVKISSMQYYNNQTSGEHFL